MIVANACGRRYGVSYNPARFLAHFLHCLMIDVAIGFPHTEQRFLGVFFIGGLLYGQIAVGSSSASSIFSAYSLAATPQ